MSAACELDGQDKQQREREREGERERERERGKFQNCCVVFKIDFSNLRQNLVTLSRMFSLTKVPTSA